MLLQSVDTAVTAICQAQNKSELLDAMEAGVTSLGFQSFNVSCSKIRAQDFMIDPTLSSFSAEDLNVYHRGDWANRDPLLERAARQGLREIWQPRDWSNSPDTRDYAEYIGSTGIQSGATAALVGRQGTVSAITALSFIEQHRHQDAAHAIFILGQAALTKAALLGIASIDLPAVSEAIASLSSRQRAIIGWAAQGKSNRDIAEIMEISKRTVDYHMSEALKKLGVASRAQAAILLSGE